MYGFAEKKNRARSAWAWQLRAHGPTEREPLRAMTRLMHFHLDALRRGHFYHRQDDPVHRSAPGSCPRRLPTVAESHCRARWSRFLARRYVSVVSRLLPDVSTSFSKTSTAGANRDQRALYVFLSESIRSGRPDRGILGIGYYHPII